MLAFLRITNNWPGSLRFVIATLALFSAFLVQIPFESYVTGEPFLLFLIVVLICTIAFGRWLGLLTLAGSFLLAELFFEPHLPLRVSNAADLLALEIYGALGVVSVFGISHLMNALMVTYDRIAVVERKNALLLSEMAHRVANNFATVGALIRRKAEAMSDPEARSALDAAMEQVNVMARVHARLRSEKENLVIRSRQFFDELCHDLRGTIPADRAITIEGSFIDTPLPFARAVLLGLIVNELLTNSVKYAFSDGRSGTVHVSLEGVGHRLCLSVSDNGVGLHGASRSSGQGRELVAGLSQQLGGRIDYQATDQGTRVQIIFPRLESFEGRACASARESSAVRNEKRALPAERRSLH